MIIIVIRAALVVVGFYILIKAFPGSMIASFVITLIDSKVTNNNNIFNANTISFFEKFN